LVTSPRGEKKEETRQCSRRRTSEKTRKDLVVANSVGPTGNHVTVQMRRLVASVADSGGGERKGGTAVSLTTVGEGGGTEKE